MDRYSKSSLKNSRISLVILFVAAFLSANMVASHLLVQQPTKVVEGSLVTQSSMGFIPSKTPDCARGGYTWSYGPKRIDVANQVEQQLRETGLETDVTAQSFGEMDTCGYFSNYAIDFSVVVGSLQEIEKTEKLIISEMIREILASNSVPRLGNLKVEFRSDNSVLSMNNLEQNSSTDNMRWQKILQQTHHPKVDMSMDWLTMTIVRFLFYSVAIVQYPRD